MGFECSRIIASHRSIYKSNELHNYYFDRIQLRIKESCSQKTLE